MKKILASLALLLLPSGLLAQAVPSQDWNYTDASGNQIPFTFGVDTSRVYRLTFPANITSTLQNEVLALPQFNNYSVSGANPTGSSPRSSRSRPSPTRLRPPITGT